MNSFCAEFKRSIEGEVYCDPITREVYSVDASIYEVVPEVIIIPKNNQDILNTIKLAKKYSLPITPRGAATGITGGCLGKGIILDTSKHLNRILEINYDEEYAICEPGVIQDQLNEVLALKDYRLGPDTSTGNRATLGGMLANNAAGARSLFYGKMVDHILEVDIALENGQIITLGNQHSEENASNLYLKIFQIKEKYKNEIENKFPRIPRRVSGYNLDELVKDFNLAKLIAGSEGTLGVITKMKIQICKKPKQIGLCLLFFKNMIDGLNYIDEILKYSPLSVEMIDDNIIEMGKHSPSMQGKLSWLQGNPKMILAIEFQSETTEELKEKIRIFQTSMADQHIGYSQNFLLEKEDMNNVWEIRKAGLGLLLSKRSYSRAIAFIEDVSVSPKNLATFMEDFMKLLKNHNKEAGIYGHVGSGCMHIRPYIDLRDEKEIQLIEEIMKEVTDLLIKYGGSLSGEHGDGYVRSWLNKKLFGDKLYQAFKEIKEAFDPHNLMNPNKIVEGLPLIHDLRMDPSVVQNKLDTFLDFSKEGGFELSVDLCNGNGQCRKPEKLMCPSFQATKDEYDTTRARAQVLRAIINGKLPKEEFKGKNIQNILKLCLECKGCKTECPSQIDMAKIKSELLYQHQKENGTSIRAKIFSHIGIINKWLSPFAKIVNLFLRGRFNKLVMSFFRISAKRGLPSLASETFSTWLKKNKSKNSSNANIVVLFNDTFTEYNFPEIGIAAYKTLEHLGYTVVVPEWNCCGRPMISKGLLEQAQKACKKNMTILSSFARRNLPIIVLEPSCLSAFTDDYLSFFKDDNKELKETVNDVSRACISFEKFILNHYKKHGLNNLNFNEFTDPIVVHRHCHQKALETENPTMELLKLLNIKAEEIPSGCCGVAGSFGYEKEHYEISMKIGELHLFPFIKKQSKDVVIVANGTSCRGQILHGTERKAFHIAEIMQIILFSKQPF